MFSLFMLGIGTYHINCVLLWDLFSLIECERKCRSPVFQYSAVFIVWCWRILGTMTSLGSGSHGSQGCDGDVAGVRNRQCSHFRTSVIGNPLCGESLLLVPAGQPRVVGKCLWLALDDRLCWKDFYYFYVEGNIIVLWKIQFVDLE